MFVADLFLAFLAMRTRAFNPKRPIKGGNAERLFKIGDRVRLSELGRTRYPHMSKSGTVVGYSNYATSVRIQFDGRQHCTLIHTSYVDKDTSSFGC